MQEAYLIGCELYLRGHPNVLLHLTDLNYKDDWSLAVALLLATRTKDSLVNSLLKELDLSLASVKRLDVQQLRQMCKPFGFSWKGDSVKHLSKTWPMIQVNPANIRSVKGCGQKVEDVFLNVLGYEIRVGVDTHVLQSCRRVFKDNFLTIAKCRKKLNSLVLERNTKKFLHTFLLRWNKGNLYCDCTWCDLVRNVMSSYE